MRQIYAQRVNRIVEEMLKENPPLRWFVYPRGTVVAFAESVSPSAIAADAQDFMLENGLVHEGSPSADFDVWRCDDAWVVNFEAPQCIKLFGVLLDSAIDSDMLAGFFQRNARELDTLSSPVVSNANFVA